MKQHLPASSDPRLRVGILGTGRAGTAFAAALAAAGHDVSAGSARDDAFRTAAASSFDLLLVCVPDGAIGDVASALAADLGQLQQRPVVAHVAGAVPLSALDTVAAVGCSIGTLHPLRVLPAAPDAEVLVGASAAVGAGDDATRGLLHGLALELGMRPFDLAEAGRAAYHAAASIAANFPLTLLDAATRLAQAAGMDEEEACRVLAELAIGGLREAAAVGPRRALTGPIVRSDRETVAAHEAAIAEYAPDFSPTYEAMADATARLAARVEVSP